MTKQIDVDSLSANELKQLQAEVAYRLNEQRRSAGFSPDEIETWEALNKATLSRRLSLKDYVASTSHAEYAGIVDYMNDFITQGCGRSLAKGERMVIRNLLCRCLAEYLLEHNEPATPRRMCDLIDWLPYAADAAFPGYADARMLHVVLASGMQAA